MVSIIVPVFNGEKYLREALESILHQTFGSTEVIVMDDCSTDATPKIIESYGARIRHVRQLRNRGIYNNVNDAISIARGKYIAAYHADDVYDPRIVEREVEFLDRHSEIGAVFCEDIFVDAANHEYGRLQLPSQVSGHRLLAFPDVLNALLEYKNRMFVCPTAMVRASVYNDLGGYRQDKFLNSSDLDMWVRIAKKYPIAILDEYLLRYRHSEEQSSRRYHKMRTDSERFFTIMDLYLEDGGRKIATPRALAAYEGHRMEDLIMTAVNLYILGRLSEAGSRLSQVTLRKLAGGHRIQRSRMIALWLVLHALVRLPRIALLANLFHHHWHIKGKSKAAFSWREMLFRQGPLKQD